MRSKLDALDLPYLRMELPELGERRLFLHTPTGILLEWGFERVPRPAVSQRKTHVQTVTFIDTSSQAWTSALASLSMNLPFSSRTGQER
jgi:hypothetical protein